MRKNLIIVLLALMMVFSSSGGSVFASGAAQQAQLAVPIMVVNTSFLNIRTGPGTQYTVLVTVVGGTELPVLGVADDGVWYLVATPVGNGWVNVDYVLPRGDFRYVPLIDPAVVAPVVIVNTPVTIGLPTQPGVVVGQQGAAGAPFATVERFRALINVDSVNVRTAPMDNAPVLVTLLRDDTQDYAIVGRTHDPRGFDWLAIHVPDVGSGWVEAPKIFMRLSARYRDVLIVVGNEVGLTPVSGSSQGRVLTQGTELYLLEISRDGQQVKVETFDGIVGWVPFNSVITRQGTTTDDIGDVPDTPQVGTQGNIYVQGSGVTVVGQSGAVVPQVAAPATPIAIVNTGNLNVRSGPGGHFTDIATLPGGTQVAIIGMVPDQMWYLVQGWFGQGWIDTDYILVRGNLDPVPVISYEAAGGSASVAFPVAVVSNNLVLYSAPGTHFGQVGVLVGPTEASIVARNADFSWVQLNTPYGYGWVPAGQVIVRGDASLIPIV